MSSLRMVEAKLPPGFRFHPRDDELVCDYLFKKWNGSESSLLIDVDLNKCEPWDIPETASVGLNVGGKEWYFYSQRDRKYATGLRTNRATISGYWKATGKDRPVIRKGNLVGMRKTLVFYQGRAPKGKKTEWVMHEYRVEGPFGPPKASTSKEDWVLCRVFYKNKDQVPSRSSMENDSNSCYDETASSSLPPLTDSYISFEQTDHHPNTDSYQQVPCFSNYSPTQNNPSNPTTFPPHNNIFQLDPITISTTNTKNYTTTSHPTFGSGTSINMPDALATNTIISPLACDHDKKVIEAVLSHLTKMENSPNLKGSPPSLGEAASASNSESFLSEVNVWSHY